MIITLFTILIGIALFMVVIGFATDTMVFATIGFFLIFLLSFSLINPSLEYSSGVNVTQVGNTSVVINTYTLYLDSTQYGIYLAIASALGMILCFIQKKRSLL
jgi:hypothetical protein